MPHEGEGQGELTSRTSRECAQSEAGAAEALTFTLPFPPSTNQIWRTVDRTRRNGIRSRHTILTHEAIRYREMVAWALVNQGVSPDLKLSGRITAIVRYHPPNGLRRDSDNLSKSLYDALERYGVLLNDRYVVCRVEAMGDQVKGGSVNVTLAWRSQ